MKYNNQEIKTELTKNLDDLYIELGHSLYDEQNILPPSSQKLIKLAKEYLNEKNNEICEKLKNNKKLSDALENNADEATLISIIIDTLLALNTLFPPLTLAVLIYKIGLKNFCNKNKENA